MQLWQPPILDISRSCERSHHICHSFSFFLWSPSRCSSGLSDFFNFFNSHFPIHRTYFWVLPPQMALLGFFHVNSLFASPVHSRKPEFTGQQALGEREVTWWGKKKKKEEEKSPEKNHFAVTGIWTLGLCLQSRACYPLGLPSCRVNELRKGQCIKRFNSWSNPSSTGESSTTKIKKCIVW